MKTVVAAMLLMTALFLTTTQTASASPYDGLYGVLAYAAYSKDAGSDVTVVQGPNYLNLFEMEGGEIVVTLLNPHTNEWQAYSGKQQGSVITAKSLYSQTDYGANNVFTEQEIRLEFSVGSTGGLFSHTLIADPKRVISGSGRVEIIKQIPLYKISRTPAAVTQ